MAAKAPDWVCAKVCSSVKVSIPVPSFAVAATLARKVDRLELVTPLRPIKVMSAAVNAGLGVPPAAVIINRSTIPARFCTSVNVSTPKAPCRRTMSLSRPIAVG